MNVTLLISFRVVTPCRTLSRADSRRKVMPSSRATRLISDAEPLVQNHLADALGQVEQLMNRGPAAESGAAALEAARALVEGEVAPLRGIEAAFDQVLIRVVHPLLAVVADDAHQPLRQDAVQRRNEIVRLDAHVQEAAEHVEHVIGVDGGEDQVAGQRGVDGDLRGLLVADFANHDLVGIVAENGSQTAREGQPLLLVYRDLRDALDLVFDGVLDSDDLVFVVLDLTECRVKRGGLTGTGRPGDQHHPVGSLI